MHNVNCFTDDDYSNHTRSGLFSVGQTKYTLCIKTNDDSILENNEIFSVVAVASSPTAKHFITCNATANVTIQDNDSKLLTYIILI